MKKIVISLNINNYQPAIRALTYPLMKNYAQKIRADFVEITERKFLEWPIVMEKFQVAELAKGYDWSIFFDADALINPEFFDVTNHLTKDQVCFNGRDFSGLRSYADKYFLRDGRYTGACDWCCISSDWTRDDLYTFPEGKLEDYLPNIHCTNGERDSGCFHDHHLIDDYTLSRNISRFGLHHTTIMDVCGSLGFRLPNGQGFNNYLFHLYAISEREKINRMLDHLVRPREVPPGQPPGWGLLKPEEAAMFRQHWNLDSKAAAK